MIQENKKTSYTVHFGKSDDGTCNPRRIEDITVHLFKNLADEGKENV